MYKAIVQIIYLNGKIFARNFKQPLDIVIPTFVGAALNIPEDTIEVRVLPAGTADTNVVVTLEVMLELPLTQDVDRSAIAISISEQLRTWKTQEGYPTLEIELKLFEVQKIFSRV